MSLRTPCAQSFFADAPVKGSRFEALVAPATTERQAADAITAARSRWPDASHHCFAWRLSNGHHRCSDDGEPGGSAGRPILAMIDGHQVVDVVVVVARWFGGTKLGVGGLIRAYGGCAGRALDASDLREHDPEVLLRCTFDYPDTTPVQLALEAAGAEITAADYGARVHLRFKVPARAAQALDQQLQDGTAGRVTAQVMLAEGEGET